MTDQSEILIQTKTINITKTIARESIIREATQILRYYKKRTIINYEQYGKILNRVERILVPKYITDKDTIKIKTLEQIIEVIHEKDLFLKNKLKPYTKLIW